MKSLMFAQEEWLGIFCAGKNAIPSPALRIQTPSTLTKRVHYLDSPYLVWRLRNEGLTELKKQVGSDQFDYF